MHNILYHSLCCYGNSFHFTNQADPQVQTLICVYVCVCVTGMQSQEKLLFTICHHISAAEQPHPPAEEDMARHRQVCVCVCVCARVGGCLGGGGWVYISLIINEKAGDNNNLNILRRSFLLSFHNEACCSWEYNSRPAAVR